ncbi:hypothetical protein JRQ81_008690 [Phrynocephalus forsythii]|uniref:LEM domain-containing protein n=1 Tax=Phrynocephalus forsythii TaxID=171643 RepID=A0A9Q0XAP1_9SAUR|nr:hypothetical protein JRQ81_008690 [Phrynocephalus forsythii]
MMLATKFRHVTHRVATPDGSSSSSSSSLFEDTLEMPRRPRRVRSPEAKPPPSRKEPHGTLCPETSIPPQTEADGPDRGPFIAASPSSSRPGGSGPSDLPPPAPAMSVDRYFHGPGGSAGRGPSGDPEAKSPGQEREPSPPLPRSHQGDAPSLETAPAERPGVRGGEAKGAPRPARVSFSRRPAQGLPCPPAVSARPPGRLSPGSQAVPLSPGGRPVHMSATEPVEFLYVDEDQGHTLVERHVPCTDDSLANTTAEDTVLYDWRAYAHPAARQGASPPPAASGTGPLSDEALASRLRDLGVHPGPVTGLTRKLYLQLLEKLSSDPKTKARKGPSGYSPELSLALETYQIPDGKGDEMALAGQFDQPDKRKNWREGLLKSSFNYLLLDPRVTQNLPFRSQFVSQAECFRTFVSAVFYVGKGKRSRPYSHLYEALSHHHHHQGKGREKEVPPKVRHILEVWAAGQGVVSMHCFQNVIPVEAYTREACMVDAIGLKMLTNQKRGHYYGVVAGWPMKRRRRLGVHLLHRAMQILLAEGERQLRPADIQAGP